MPDIRKDGREVGGGNSKPGSQGGAVLVDRGSWNPATPRARSLIGVVRTIRSESREHGTIGTGYPIEVRSSYRPAHHEMMGAPGMVGSQRSVRHERSREVR